MKSFLQQTLASKHLSKFALSLSLGALVACGGGTTPAANGADSVTTASTATATASGATVIPTANSTSTAYTLVADIGDTWTISFDSSNNTYAVTMVATQFSLTGTSGAYASSKSGTFTTYVLANGKGTVVVDERTKAISGNMTVGTKTATVTGTAYQATDLSKLAGTYNFIYNTRNQSNGQYKDTGAGQLKINAAGTVATLCSNGTVNALNTCDVIDTSGTAELNTLNLALVNGAVIVSYAGVEWGRLHIHAGDLGTALIIDRYGVNGDGILRVGAMYAVKSQALSTTAANGTWICNELGAPSSTVAISGAAVTFPNGSGNATNQNIRYNEIAGTSAYFAANGWFNSGAATTAIGDRTNGILLSSSLMVIIEEYGYTSVCRKSS